MAPNTHHSLFLREFTHITSKHASQYLVYPSMKHETTNLRDFKPKTLKILIADKPNLITLYIIAT